LLLVTAIAIWWDNRLWTTPAVKSAQVATVGTPATTASPPGFASLDTLWRRDTGVTQGEVPPGDPSKLDALALVDERAAAWAKVDLEEIRKAMPDNLYWKMAAPTTDPEVQRARDEERARWNVEYGKVLSNTATAEEIDAYYAQQQRLSTDYLEFLVYLGTHYAEVIPQQDVGVLKLAGELHLARLEEIPRKIAEAHERREAHEAVRRAWLEEQKAFEDGPSQGE
jgi:hypothetical protein